ncbi:DPP IV N-terminal domain-containing protein [Streptomyces sp. NPDC096339]|uniref:DPP IV N-terminal domain-containing protein n=1 Tax=Streptomyces sp. NPDC096339 TaxID=3366086 RepID=UPI003825A747
MTRHQHRATVDGRAAGKPRRTGVNRTARRRRVAWSAMAVALTVPLTLGAAGGAGAAGERAIVFARYTTAAPTEDLYAISPGGGTPVALTHTPAVSDVMPSWSPDGKRVAFVRYGSGGAVDGIWTMRATGGDLKAVPGTKGASDPAWSPDGKRIAYAMPVGAQREIHVADIDGTPATRLTHTAADDLHPTWSPDGKYLAFNRADTAGNSRVMKIRLSTLAQTAVTGPGSHDWTPDWSHGDRIAFSRVDSSGFAHLYLIRPDGTGLHRITSDRFNDKNPSWSPDGRRLVFTRGGTDDADPEHLYLVRADGTAPTQLTKTDAHDLEADWRP